MSNTKRRDYYVDACGVSCMNKDWMATADRKKWYKPSKKDKHGWLEKIRLGRKIEMKRAMLHPDDDGEIILPKEKRTDVWYYN